MTEPGHINQQDGRLAIAGELVDWTLSRLASRSS